MSKKTFLLTVFGGLMTLGATVLLWKQPILTVFVLALISAGTLFQLRDKKILGVYVYGFFFGPISEAVAIHFGLWAYAEPHFLGIPLWLPFVWGSAGVALVSVYLFLSGSQENERS